MRRWVVTGPAGSGKSALCAMLADRGAAVLDGDRLGHEILGREDVAAAVEAEFGSGVVAEGAVVRSVLGPLVFNDPAALESLNRITHGPLSVLMAERLGELEKGGRYRLAVLEAAVYFLLPPVPRVELVVTVTADPSVRIARLVATGLDEARARARIMAQGHMEHGWAGADLVLNNDGTLENLRIAADTLWQRIGE